MEIILPLSQIPPDLLEYFEPADAPVNPPDVLRISAEPLREKHYAAFPTELVTRCLKAGTSAKGYCPECGAPWCRVIEQGFIGDMNYSEEKKNGVSRLAVDEWFKRRAENPPKTIGWRPTCEHADLEPRPPRVLDPFCGSGRTGTAAMRLGCDFWGVELNPEYAAMSERIIVGDAPLFNETA